jgi:hypothetical protein
MAYKKYGIPPSVQAGLIEQESGWNPAAVSSEGAQGLTQFIPSTARSYGVMYGTSHKAVASQIMGMARYLRDLGFKDDPRLALGNYYGDPSSSYPGEVLAKSAGYRGFFDQYARQQRGGRDGGRAKPSKPKENPTRGARTSLDIRDARTEARWDSLENIADDGVVTARERRRAERAYMARAKVFNDRIKRRRRRLAKVNRALRGKLTKATRRRLLAEKGQLVRDINSDISSLKSLTVDFRDRTTPEPADVGDAGGGGDSGANDALTAAVEENNRLLAERNALQKEQLAVQKRIETLTKTQGPALLSALAQVMNGSIGGNAGLGRSYPSFAGLGGLART